MDTEALRQNAGRILAMFREVLGRGDPKMLLYAAGMAGMSCHEAVKAEGRPFAVIELKDGTRRYMGDALNHYLLEDRMSVLAYIEGWFAHFAQGEQKPDPMALVTWAVQVLGTPEEKLLLVEHMLISHHGKPEYGAAEPPKFLEAIVLAKLDELDATVFEVENTIRNVSPNEFSNAVWALDNTRLFNTGRKEITPEAHLLEDN